MTKKFQEDFFKTVSFLGFLHFKSIKIIHFSLTVILTGLKLNKYKELETKFVIFSSKSEIKVKFLQPVQKFLSLVAIKRFVLFSGVVCRWMSCSSSFRWMCDSSSSHHYLSWRAEKCRISKKGPGFQGGAWEQRVWRNTTKRILAMTKSTSLCPFLKVSNLSWFFFLN